MKYISLFLLLFSMRSFAYDVERARNNLVSDYAACSAFFIVISQGDNEFKRDPRFRKFAEMSYNLAVKLSNAGVAEARIEFYSKQMMRDMKYDWSNVKVIMDKYMFMCKDALVNPDDRLQYWLEKED